MHLNFKNEFLRASFQPFSRISFEPYMINQIWKWCVTKSWDQIFNFITFLSIIMFEGWRFWNNINKLKNLLNYQKTQILSQKLVFTTSQLSIQFKPKYKKVKKSLFLSFVFTIKYRLLKNSCWIRNSNLVFP